ncbi:MAG: four helix bundle protein [Phycisphaerales bacterium]
MKKVRTFRDLIAWQRGMELAEAVYAATRLMPDSERFGLISQLRRAAVSIPSNIAEGHARASRPDYIRFLRVARGSLAELSTQLELAVRLRHLDRDPQLSDLVDEQARILQGLIKSLERLNEQRS